MPSTLVDDAQHTQLELQGGDEVDGGGGAAPQTVAPVDDEGLDGQGEDEEEDWLMSDDEGGNNNHGSHDTINGDASGETEEPSTPSLGTDMTSRDSAKVQRVFYDTGYREGITSGKLSTLQSGFDEGFNQAAPLGRAKGFMRGQVLALLHWNNSNGASAAGEEAESSLNGHATASSSRPVRGARRGGGLRRVRGGGAVGRALPVIEGSDENVPEDSPASRSSSPAPSQPLRTLLDQVDALNVETLLGPDWEARRHAQEEHGGGGAAEDDGSKHDEELAKAAQAREGLETLRQRLDRVVAESCGTSSGVGAV